MQLKFTIADCLESAEIIGGDRLEEALKKGQKLRIKLGIDPTSPDVHLGRSIPLWRLRAFQELGHQIELIIGDFTGQIGDTSDKESERPMLSEETVQHNLKNYMEQFWKVLNPELKDQVNISYNSTWLNKLSLGQISLMADAFSVNQFIKRELVAKRLEEGSRVSLREMLYPLMQGYDSLAVEADVEIGGTDQRFNLLAGRILQEQAGKPAQSIIMNFLIRGTDGRKMSSSWGNVIKILDTPTDKFGLMMTVGDDVMAEYLLCLPICIKPFTADELEMRMKTGENPRDLKLELAYWMVALYHGEEEATKCKEQFINQFSKHQLPEDIPVCKVGAKEIGLVELLVELELAPSKGEARRLIEQGGVRLDQAVMTDVNLKVDTSKIELVQVGKRRLVRVELV